jgi:hypothetical protein
MIEQFERFTDEMCACTTNSCAQGVSERMSTWGTRVAKEQAESKERPDKAAQDRMMKVAERMTTCMQKAMASPSE